MNPTRSLLTLGVQRLAAVALAAALLALLPPVQGGAAGQAGRFTDTTDVVLVEIPVQVLRDGQPVRGLTAADFEVYDGRKREPIVSFDVVDLTVTDERQVVEGEVPLAGRRHFLLLFDLSFSSPTAIVKARRAAQELVTKGLHPTDLVAVATYSQAGTQLVLGFTTDRLQVAYALETLGVARPNESVRDPLGIMMADVESFRSRGENLGGGGFGFDADAEIMEVLSAAERDTRREAERNAILAMSDSLGEIAGLLGAIQGRKHVVLLSEGFDNSIIIGTEDLARIQEMNTASEFGQTWEIDSDERFGSTSAQNQLIEMLADFQRADAVIQSVDIGGLRAGADVRPRPPGQEGLFMMANETGGEFFRNYNDLSGAMGALLERNSVTYLLAIQPENLKLDGKPHKLKVKLKNDARGVTLVHRPGYYAPKPYSQQSGMERRIATAGLVLGGAEGGGIGASVLAVPFEGGEGGKAYVPVLIEIDGASLMGSKSSSVLPTEIYAYALDRIGGVRDTFSQVLGLDLDKVGPALAQSGFKFWGDFELPPGEYVVRVLVRNSETGDLGLRVAPLTVPDLGAAQSALLPPLVPEAPGKWLLGRETRPEGSAQPPYPFILRTQPFIPAARPELKSRQATELCMVGYNLGDGELAVSGRLLGGDGSAAVETGKLEVSERLRLSSGREQFVATWKPGKLAAGEYTLEVTVTDSATGKRQTSSIPVVVSG